jgi:hypothetical protein
MVYTRKMPTTILPIRDRVAAHLLRERQAPPAPDIVSIRMQRTVAQRINAKAHALGIDKSLLLRLILVEWLEHEDGINPYMPL